ncbi:hypothetical protein [Nocardia rosealba]|uniref:hypothetical protein n=1 Tax=Nocardia rosealba TaxID=2878563 RepID=UPI001CDA43C9|nr:hypothetical protein [Nocardia rosealba]MCA2209709.1 hypothetical protein [Nocardia rosealba]
MIRLSRSEGLVTVGPGPLITDISAPLDAMVLEVVGGHLSWSVLDDRQMPAAVLDDADAAQDWLWAIYGESVALAVADGVDGELATEPARADLVVALRRLAYAHWASRWWPASTVDGIPALDPNLLDEEIRQLSERCEMVLADSELIGIGTGEDLADLTYRRDAPAQQSAPPARSTQSGDDATGPMAEAGHESTSRADDYALAAGGTRAGDGLVMTRGSGDWDWRRCPPGLFDAGGNTLSWNVVRSSGGSKVRVTVVAAPDCPPNVPEHLRPRVGLGFDIGTELFVTIGLKLRTDSWSAEIQLPEGVETFTTLSVFVPGVGPESTHDESAERARIRDFVRRRLTGQTTDPLLTAESAAAESDEDF